MLIHDAAFGPSRLAFLPLARGAILQRAPGKMFIINSPTNARICAGLWLGVARRLLLPLLEKKGRVPVLRHLHREPTFRLIGGLGLLRVGAGFRLFRDESSGREAFGPCSHFETKGGDGSAGEGCSRSNGAATAATPGGRNDQSRSYIAPDSLLGCD
jgi:hypothetical protein